VRILVITGNILITNQVVYVSFTFSS
jgi:hypothetical protein